MEKVKIFEGYANDVEKETNAWLKKHAEKFEIVSRQMCHAYGDLAHQLIVIAIFYKDK